MAVVLRNLPFTVQHDRQGTLVRPLIADTHPGFWVFVTFTSPPSWVFESQTGTVGKLVREDDD